MGGNQLIPCAPHACRYPSVAGSRSWSEATAAAAAAGIAAAAATISSSSNKEQQQQFVGVSAALSGCAPKHHAAAAAAATATEASQGCLQNEEGSSCAVTCCAAGQEAEAPTLSARQCWQCLLACVLPYSSCPCCAASARTTSTMCQLLVPSGDPAGGCSGWVRARH